MSLVLWLLGKGNRFCTMRRVVGSVCYLLLSNCNDFALDLVEVRILQLECFTCPGFWLASSCVCRGGLVLEQFRKANYV